MPTYLDKSLPGVYVALEGWEASGKTTQTQNLVESLRELFPKIPVRSTFEPGATRLGGSLRETLLHSDTVRHASRAQCLLFAADNSDHVERVVLPVLRAGGVVVSDRSLGSALAYQGYGSGFKLSWVRSLYSWATYQVVPDLTVCLHQSWGSAWRRFQDVCGERDTVESAAVEYHKRVHAGYADLVDLSFSWMRVNCSAAESVVASQVLDIVMKFLDRRSLAGLWHGA